MPAALIVAGVVAAVGAPARAVTTGAGPVDDRSGRPAAALSQVQLAQLFDGSAIDDIRVEGSQRIEPTTIRSYLSVSPGDPFDPALIDKSLKDLFDTGLFADVTLVRDERDLVVRVVENPIINRIAFEGNNRIDDEQLQSEIQLRPRVVVTRTRVQNDVQRVIDVYRRNGRFAVTVDPKVIQLEQNRVDLVFEIDEGPRTGVLSINFIGNKAFSDGTLRDQIQTAETAWYRFLTSDDTYDPDRLAFDRELLRRFYLSEGYADFRVVSAVAELSPERDGFFITFTIEEGERYRFGTVEIATGLKNLEPETLRDVVTTEEGDWYDATEVDASIEALTQAVGDLQYAFVDVRPRVRRIRDELLVEVLYQIEEGPRVFVERIEITGNVRTLDRVIRREMLLAEGDPFSATKLERSEQRIRDLGFFERVAVQTTQGSAPDRTVIEVEVIEQSTGEISIGAGFSTTDGGLLDFAIRERNLLGRGQDLRIGATLSGRRQEYDLSFTEPYFLGRDLSAGFDIFRVTLDSQDESSFDEENTGAGIRVGYPLTERLRQRLSYTFTHTRITSVPSDASRFIKDQEGSRNLSLVTQELFYDTRDSRLAPTEGYSVRLVTDLAGLGGSARFVRARIGSNYYYSIFDNYVLRVGGEIGQIYGIGEDISIADRFFIGGDSLRGFAVAGIGPRDLATDDALGGSQFARGTVELTFPLGLPSEFDLSGHLFTDVGTLANVDDSGTGLVDEHAIRLAAGFGVSWRSPFGPIRVDFAIPLVKKDYDETEEFRFSFGTRF